MWVRVDDGRIVAASLSPVDEDGWSRVTEVARPDDTDEATWDAGVAVVDGVPTWTWTARPWLPEEWAQLPAERREALRWRRRRAELRDTVVTGLAALAAARQAAEADVAIAEDLRGQAQAMQASLATLQASLAAFTPAATYQQAQLGQIRSAIASVVATQATIAATLAELYGYRRGNDQVAINAHRSLEFLARVIFEVDS